MGGRESSEVGFARPRFESNRCKKTKPTFSENLLFWNCTATVSYWFLGSNTERGTEKDFLLTWPQLAFIRREYKKKNACVSLASCTGDTDEEKAWYPRSRVSWKLKQRNIRGTGSQTWDRSFCKRGRYPLSQHLCSIKKKFWTCFQEYLSVHEKLDPGYNKWRGRIMEEMSTPYIISQLSKWERGG